MDFSTDMVVVGSQTISVGFYILLEAARIGKVGPMDTPCIPNRAPIARSRAPYHDFLVVVYP
jgi:hypothetical protein